jgi:hypothetical protein
MTDRSVDLTLTNTQVLQVLRHGSGQAALSETLAKLDDLQTSREMLRTLLHQRSYSLSTLRALLILTAFDAAHPERELAEVAHELDLSPSTAHRYVRTWLALGLLDQDPASRRYRQVS